MAGKYLTTPNNRFIKAGNLKILGSTIVRNKLKQKNCRQTMIIVNKAMIPNVVENYLDLSENRPQVWCQLSSVSLLKWPFLGGINPPFADTPIYFQVQYSNTEISVDLKCHRILNYLIFHQILNWPIQCIWIPFPDHIEYIWVNSHMSLTWNYRPFGDDYPIPMPIHSSWFQGSVTTWGHHNLPMR